ncbi:hypothetical protein MTR01_25285 [Burkholderia thailandensis]|uniref:hypothetical protein n=1 Tax=Burkholderia thailandensis TaxID=57975 RepID=UPI0022ABEE50|nr:hypothetical protein [Burkholderia thailandensis]MCZ2897339.1 hypothetical protein [Burkholderia thailandensis]
MKERPILFSGPMVRAILDGRKTQTRRIAVPKRSGIDFIGGGPMDGPDWNDPTCWGFEAPNTGLWWALRGDEQCYQLPCPYGRPGDRMWVRETHDVNRLGSETFPDGRQRLYAGIAYQADDGRHEVDITDSQCRAIEAKKWRGWTPSIHMPRWASRITLEVTGVRVERLQDISEVDAISEGIDKTAAGFWSTYGQCDVDGTYSPRLSYQCLWDSLNAARGFGWDANPWVWVVEFAKSV